MIVLTLNGGSSSVKFGLYRAEDGSLDALMTGETDQGRLNAQDAHGATLPGTPARADSPEKVLAAIAGLLESAGLPSPDAVGHRIVHGGPKVRSHCQIDDGVMRALEDAVALSPLHGPAALEMIRLARQTWPGVPQVACIDTAFHADMPDVARTLPVAASLRAQGIERYGFHGLSCESIVRQLGRDLPARLIIAHLGSGASVTAVRDGRSVDTSMGLTPSGGVVMATRSGDLDPGVLIYLLRERRLDAAALEDLIDHRSGLLGVSGLGGDLRELRAAEPSSPDARLAIAMFCLSVAKAIAGMIVTLGGVDAIVFTGGIGEHDAATRATICRHLAPFGVQLDASRNNAATDGVEAEASRCRLRVLPSLEDEQIALHTGDLADGPA